MKQCLGCRGLVPESLESCPNCAVERRTGLKGLVAAAGVVALVASSCGVPMPVYGIACTSKQFDGGHNGCPGECTTLLDDGGLPARDSSNSCFKADGGIP